MFHVNDVVVCGNNGICRIENIERKKIMNQQKEFYVMVPILTADSSTLKTKIVLAIDTNRPIRYVKSKDEVTKLLNELSAATYYNERDYKKREKVYKEVINSEDIFQYLHVLHTIYSDNAYSSSTDRLYIEVIKRICNEEVSYALSLETPVEAEKYIHHLLS